MSDTFDVIRVFQAADALADYVIGFCEDRPQDPALVRMHVLATELKARREITDAPEPPQGCPECGHPWDAPQGPTTCPRYQEHR